ncbi:hypothetical protein RUND412_010503 [Rhizina undulata]
MSSASSNANQRPQQDAHRVSAKRPRLQMNYENAGGSSAGSSSSSTSHHLFPTIPPPRPSRSFDDLNAPPTHTLFLPTPSFPRSFSRSFSRPLPTTSYVGAPTSVIDLTESPPPSPPNNNPASNPTSTNPVIIDVDALPDVPGPSSLGGAPPISLWTANAGNVSNLEHNYYPRPSSSNDIQFRFSRDVSWRRGVSAASLNPGRHPPARPVEPNALYERIEREGFQPRLNNRPEDPILGHGGRIDEGIPDSPEAPVQRIGALPDMMRFFHTISGSRGGLRNLHRMEFAYRGPDEAFQVPGQLDYRQRAPGIISESAEEMRRRSTEYKAPGAARQGFTRSPREADLVVCADCGWELGTVQEGEKADGRREEVWASRCGHSYCGFCAHSYRTPPAKSNSKRPRPKMKTCVVGCKQNLANKSAMFKIHL